MRCHCPDINVNINSPNVYKNQNGTLVLSLNFVGEEADTQRD